MKNDIDSVGRRRAVFCLLAFLAFPSSLFGIDASSIVSDANSLIGQKYVWGGESFEEGGFDCSGLVYYIMKKHNVEMPRTAAAQYEKATMCPEVSSLSQAQIGDAVYFRSQKTGKIHHVAIITGFDSDGTPIITHARDRKSGVLRQRMTPYYLSQVAKIRRLSECDGSKQPDDKVESPDFLDQAYKDVTGMGQKADLAARVAELTFIFRQEKCCCNPEILKAYQASTAKLMVETYPAIDLWVSALRWVKTSNDAYKKIIKNLKVANGIWSFSDLLGQVPMAKTPEVEPGNGCNLGGCQPLDWNKEEDRKKYEQVIDCFETGGKGLSKYGEGTSLSSAYGRYQFTRKTGNDYCKKVGGGCCEVWHSNTPEGRACQDKMFALFTENNLKDIPKNLPVNTCTVYIAHQQGAGGVAWLYGGSLPRGYTFEKMKDHIAKNVGSDYRARAESAGSEDELRQIYRDFWSKKFGGDIFANVGQPAGSFGDFLETSNNFSVFALRRIFFYRKGILLEQRKLDHHLDMEEKLSELINSTIEVDAQTETIHKAISENEGSETEKR